MRKDSGVRSRDSGFGIRDSGIAVRDSETANGSAPIAPDASNAPSASAASPGVRELAPVLQSGQSTRREICADVTKLAPEWRELVEQLIEDGSTFEDVTEIFKEREGPRVTLHALEVHYQSNLELQKRRIQGLIKRAEELRRSLSDPNSADAHLANATLFLGLVQLRRSSSRLTIKDAQSLRLQRENLHLRQRVLKMKLAEQVRKKSEAHQRYRFEEERRRKLNLQNQELEEILKKLRQDQTLPADVMGKIQEIYGIVKEPYIPAKLAERLPQSETP